MTFLEPWTSPVISLHTFPYIIFLFLSFVLYLQDLIFLILISQVTRLRRTYQWQQIILTSQSSRVPLATWQIIHNKFFLLYFFLLFVLVRLGVIICRLDNVYYINHACTFSYINENTFIFYPCIAQQIYYLYCYSNICLIWIQFMIWSMSFSVCTCGSLHFFWKAAEKQNITYNNPLTPLLAAIMYHYPHHQRH